MQGIYNIRHTVYVITLSPETKFHTHIQIKQRQSFVHFNYQVFRMEKGRKGSELNYPESLHSSSHFNKHK